MQHTGLGRHPCPPTHARHAWRSWQPPLTEAKNSAAAPLQRSAEPFTQYRKFPGKMAAPRPPKGCDTNLHLISSPEFDRGTMDGRRCCTGALVSVKDSYGAGCGVRDARIRGTSTPAPRRACLARSASPFAPRGPRASSPRLGLTAGWNVGGGVLLAAPVGSAPLTVKFWVGGHQGETLGCDGCKRQPQTTAMVVALANIAREVLTCLDNAPSLPNSRTTVAFAPRPSTHQHRPPGQSRHACRVTNAQPPAAGC